MSFTKDPDAVLDYLIDWTLWLTTGDTITSVSWIVPDGITKGATSNTSNTATIWLSGGTAASTYDITSRIVTAQGRTSDHTISVFVSDQ